MPLDNDEGRPGKGGPVNHPDAGINANDTPSVSQSAGIGDRVRCERQAPPRGSWKRYAGRVGTVITINVARSANGSPDVVEVGVDLDSDGRADAWFRPDELVLETGKHAPSAPRLAANGEVGSWSGDMPCDCYCHDPASYVSLYDDRDNWVGCIDCACPEMTAAASADFVASITGLAEAMKQRGVRTIGELASTDNAEVPS